MWILFRSKYCSYRASSKAQIDPILFLTRHGVAFSEKNRSSRVTKQKQIQLGIMRLGIQSLASLSGLRIQHCHELLGRSQTRLGSHVAVALIWHLAWETPYAVGVALKSQNKQTKNKTKQKKQRTKLLKLLTIYSCSWIMHRGENFEVPGSGSQEEKMEVKWEKEQARTLVLSHEHARNPIFFTRTVPRPEIELVP